MAKPLPKQALSDSELIQKYETGKHVDLSKKLKPFMKKSTVKKSGKKK
jgi:hypothetical protein